MTRRPHASSTSSSRGEHGDPHAVLGAAPARRRRHRPRAQAAGRSRSSWCTATTRDARSSHEHEGIWAGVLAAAPRSPTTGSRSPTTAAPPHVVDDPYRFLPTLGEVDLHLINEGRHEQLWEVLGAHVHRYDGPLGDRSPARRSRCGRRTPAASGSRATSTAGTAASTRCGSSAPPGSGSCSCPDVGTGTALQVRDPRRRRRSGARRPTRWRSRTEVPPATVVGGLRVDVHLGRRRLDGRARAERGARDEPMSVYEMHLGLVARAALGPTRELADQLVGLRRATSASPTSS